MDKLEEFQSRFQKQMKKQRYDNSGRKQEFIEIAEQLFKIVEEQKEENEKLLSELEKWKRAYHKLDPVGFTFNEPLKDK